MFVFPLILKRMCIRASNTDFGPSKILDMIRKGKKAEIFRTNSFAIPHFEINVRLTRPRRTRMDSSLLWRKLLRTAEVLKKWRHIRYVNMLYSNIGYFMIIIFVSTNHIVA